MSRKRKIIPPKPREPRGNPDSKMTIRSDAKSLGAVTAISTRVAARWQPSKPSKRTFDGKKFSGTSVCISYKDGVASIFEPHKTERTHEHKTHTHVTIVKAAPQSYADRVAQLGAIGDID